MAQMGVSQAPTKRLQAGVQEHSTPTAASMLRLAGETLRLAQAREGIRPAQGVGWLT